MFDGVPLFFDVCVLYHSFQEIRWWSDGSVRRFAMAWITGWAGWGSTDFISDDVMIELWSCYEHSKVSKDMLIEDWQTNLFHSGLGAWSQMCVCLCLFPLLGHFQWLGRFVDETCNHKPITSDCKGQNGAPHFYMGLGSSRRIRLALICYRRKFK